MFCYYHHYRLPQHYFYQIQPSTISTSVTTDMETKFLTNFVDVFMIYLTPNFNIPSSSDIAMFFNNL